MEYPPDYDFGLWLGRYLDLNERLSEMLGRPVDLVMVGAVREAALHRDDPRQPEVALCRLTSSARLEQIHEAAGYIEVDTAGLTFDAFMADRRTRQVVERNFEIIIGEAVNRLRRHAPDFGADQRLQSDRRVAAT